MMSISAICVLALYPLFWVYYYFTVYKHLGSNSCFCVLSAVLGSAYLAVMTLSHYAILTEERIYAGKLLLSDHA